MLRVHLWEMRSLLQESAIPPAVQWIVYWFRRRLNVREELLDRVSAVMSEIYENQDGPIEPEELVELVLDQIDTHREGVFEAVDFDFGAQFEEMLTQRLDLETTGEWEMSADQFDIEITDGKMTLEALLVGEQVESTEAPEQTVDREITRALKSWGAGYASARWEIQTLTDVDGKHMYVTYPTRAEWTFVPSIVLLAIFQDDEMLQAAEDIIQP